MIEAVRDTFWELWNMKDPNATKGPLKVGRPKVQTAIRTYLGGPRRHTPPQIEMERTPDAPKPPIPSPRRLQPPPAPRKQPRIRPDRETQKQAAKEARRLKQNARLPNPGNEPNEGTWNEVLPKEPEPLAKVRIENRLKKNPPERPPTWRWTPSCGSFSS